MASLFATCFMRTKIFITVIAGAHASSVPITTPETARWKRAHPGSFFVSLKQERCVRAAKTEAVRQRIIQVSFARLVRNVIEIAFGIGRDVVNRRWQHVTMNCEH